MLVVQMYTPKTYKERDIVYKSHIECDGDGEGCKKSTPLEKSNSALPEGWLWVRRSYAFDEDLHFCGWQCVMQYIMTHNLD